ncbi:MAG: general secretion pathway protein C [Janthinobacterium sp.]|jgi:general secretion pathway protein C
MKRLPVLLSFIVVLALSASLAYWTMQLFKPPQRLIAAAPVPSVAEPRLESAIALFGGQQVAIAASNYRLNGVVAAGDGRRSAAIMVVDGKPSQAVPVGRNVVPGSLLVEVHPKYVLLSEGGVMKRVELSVDANPRSDGLRFPSVNPPAAAEPAPTPISQPVQMPAQPGIIVVQPDNER